MSALRKAVDRLDDAVLMVERALLVFTLSLMTALVSLDVLQRTFSRQVSKTATLLLGFFSNPSPETRQLVIETIAPWSFNLGSLALVMLAVHSSRSIAAEREKRALPSLGTSAGVGAVVWLGAAAFIKAVLWVFPSSVPGAQKFSLGLMLWSGMLGASIATRQRRHIALDTLKKKLDEKTGTLFSLIAGVVTFLFCGLLTVLALQQLHGEFVLWRDGDGVGVFDALPIPKWLVTLALPLAFGTMSLRFLGAGVRDWLWGAPVGGVDAHGVDLDQLAKDAAASASEESK